MIEELQPLLEGRMPAGVYRWPAAHATERVLSAAAAAGWRGFVLNGEGVRDREAFLDACADAFALPSWYGRNWDALSDCLTDLSWAPAPGYIVVYERWNELATADPDAWATANALLVDVSRHWHAQGTPFAVIVPGEGPEVQVPSLTAARPR